MVHGLLRRLYWLITRHTFWLYIVPTRYVSGDQVGDTDLDQFNYEYEWTSDQWNGLMDYARPITQTLERQTGDCEDYALVVASILARDQAETIGFGFCLKRYYLMPIPRHVIAYDNRDIYSSGTVYNDTDVTDYIADSQYNFVLRRRVK